jgi:DNA primase large subunit
MRDVGMETLVAQMTKEELIQIIESVIERKLLELFDNFDETEIRPEVKERLLSQKKRVLQGERGHAFDSIVQQLDLG